MAEADDPIAVRTDTPADTHEEESPADLAQERGDHHPGEPDIPGEIPLLAVRNTPIFPGTVTPLTIGRPKSKDLLDAVLTGDRLVGVVAQRKEETEDPGLDDLYRIGTVAQVLKLLKLPDGHETIIVRGVVRFGIESLTSTEPYLVARINVHRDEAAPSTALEALIYSVRQQADKLIEASPNIPDEASVILSNISEPGMLADFLAANLSLGLMHKQELLETLDVLTRLRKVAAALASQLELLELSNKIQAEVKEQIDTRQRRYYLQEQLRAIQKELGEGEGVSPELMELRDRIQQAKMPEETEKEALAELARLEQINPASPEYSVSRDHLEWLAAMPWSVSTEDNLDINHAQEVLDTDHYDLEKVKKRFLEFLAVRKLRPQRRGAILCFAGPPGVGKTSLGQSIARSMGRKFVRISLGGMRDEAEIRGHRRTYIGALPGRLIRELRKVGNNNPVFMLDEVDKIGQDFRGDPASALLEVLDPQQNHTFTDHYLDVAFDLSKVFFIATANYMEPVPPALRDRMEVIDLPGYTHREKTHIARQYLIPRQLEENGLQPETLTFDDAALEAIITNYTREAGVRNLEREIASVCRAVAAQMARGQPPDGRITADELDEYLGPAKYEPEMAQRTSVAGVVTGLAWTPAGGDILFVEATGFPGKGSLLLTGQIGEVMRESAQAAYSLARSRAKKLGIDPHSFPTHDVHVHVPAGAIPKDGPSAGVAMFTAIVSLITNRPVRADVAMTGEITLRGLVLAIGGLKEKVLAAHRAGVKTIIFPRRNEKDLVDVPQDVRNELDFVPVDTVDEILEVALEPKTKAGARKRPSAARAGSRRRRKMRKTSRPRR